MTTGPANSRTYKKTIAAGAIGWGCFSIKARRHLGGFPVGCYSVNAYAARKSIHPRLVPFSYFAMCNHGNKSPGCSSRSQSIKLAKLSQNYCDECKALFVAMPTKEHHTPDLKEQVLQMIREGVTSAEAAKRVGVSPSTVSNWRNDAGLSGKRGGRAKNQPHHSTKPHNPEVREEALRLFRDGVKLKEIENRLGISYQTIYAWTRKKTSQEPPNLQVQEAHDNPLPITKPGKKSRVFGEILGVPEGSAFPDRMSLSKSGVHRPPQAGISGSKNEGADSIVVSGGYVDDKDLGHTIYYTGQGGNDPKTGRQVADQELTRGNLALSLSCDLNLPVRVVRGWKGDPEFSPSSGYRYDGLFHVVGYGPETGSDGHRVWRFKLERAEPKPISKIIGDWSVQGTKMVFRVVRENEAPHVITAWNRDTGKNFEVSKTKVIDSPNGLLVEFQTTWPETGWCTNWHFQSFKTTKAGLQILGEFVTSKSRKSTQAHKIIPTPASKRETFSLSPIGKEEPKPFRGVTCRVCQTYLDGNNSYSSMVSRSSYICKKCHNKQVRERKKYGNVKTSPLEKPPPVKTHPTPNIRLNAMQMVLDGLTDKEVAQKVGVNVRTVGKWKKKAGLTAKSGKHGKTPGRKTSPVKGEALRMIREGVKRAEVARRLGVRPSKVRDWQMKAGLSGKPSARHALKEEGLQMIREGVSGAEVARRLGVHKSTVGTWRKAAGLSGKSGHDYHDPEKENDVIDLLRDGKPLSEINRMTGVGIGTIRRWKKEAEREGFL